MKKIKSIMVVRVDLPMGGHHWCSRLRFTDGTELYAGLDNQHGRAVAMRAHTNTYARDLRPDTEFDEANPPTIGRDHTDQKLVWHPLPEGWRDPNHI